MVDNVKKLRTFRMVHHKYLHICSVSLMSTQPVSEMESHQIWYFGKGIIHDLHPSLQNRVKSDESVVDVTAFNNFFG